ncbi:MAG: hypothetical protein K940chlam9_00171 [Chlamydiae bacterium]|nr:hypothetical protein [Chlamydiota bacterium]
MSSIQEPTYSSLEKYLMEAGKFPSAWNACTEVTDRIFNLGEKGSQIGATVLTLQGKSAAAGTLNGYSHAFDVARSPLGAIRLITPWHSLFTGTMFWQQNRDGSFRRVEQEGGKAKVLSREELQQNYTYNKKGGAYIHKTHPMKRSSDGRYVDKNLNGVRVPHDWMSIAIGIMILAARTLTSINFLHSLKAFDLGKHAKGVGGAIAGLWCAVLSLDLIANIKSASEAPTMQTMRKSLVNAFCDVLDLVSLPFDFGIAMNIHPALTIVGSTLSILSSVSYIAKEYYYY